MSGDCLCDDEREFGCAVHVSCDDDCRALQDPSGADEWQAAAEHWRSHGYLSGCSHGN